MHRLSQDFWLRGSLFAQLQESEEKMNRTPVITCDGCTENSPDYDDRVHWTPHTYIGDDYVERGEPVNPSFDNSLYSGLDENGNLRMLSKTKGEAYRQMFKCDRCGTHRMYGCTERPVSPIEYKGVN